VTCREVTGFLLEYVSGALEADLRGEIDQHTAACGNCREYLREYRLTIAACQTAVQGDAPPAAGHLPAALITGVLDTLDQSG